MSAENVKSFEAILSKQNTVLKSILENQKLLRNAVLEKNWENLLKEVDEINLLSDNFQQLDKVRDYLQKELSREELHGFTHELAELRKMLSESKVENKVLSDYITITRGFINGVIDTVPQGRNKTYSRNGQIVQNQPTSVVLTMSF